MRGLKFACAVLLASTAAWAQAPAGAANVTKAPTSFDKSAMDTTADPCVDFYQYTCGGWRKNNPVPADKARYGRFDELREYNLNVLHGILEDVAKKTNRTPIEQKVGDFYSSCMDEKAVEAKGAKPIDPELKEIAAIKNSQQLLSTIAKFHHKGIGGGFSFGVGPSLHNASLNIAQIGQGGISLPDRDYYVKDDPKMKETREKYVEHVTKMFTLLGDSPEQAAKEAQAVMALETKFAEASLERVKMRDPKNRDHMMKTAELAKLAPNVNFDKFFADAGVAKFDELNVANPEFVSTFGKLVESTPLDDWKSYMRWRVLRGTATLLSKPFVDESFAFNGKYMSGQKELEARWKRCTSMTDNNLGEALGQLYVAKAFPPDAKKRMDVMVKQIEESMDADIKTLEWMSPETQKAAKGKLDKFTEKVGYPTKWKDYSTVKVGKDLVENVRQATLFEVNRNIKKLNQPVDKSEWGMTPPTVNAYYSPSNNNINFPAGILQPPFFSNAIDDSVNYGGIGVVIGHELTHGFDDQGRKFDGDGNLVDWWGPTDGPKFEERANCIVNEYGNFSPVEGVKLNGKLTLGENTADNGGMKLAFMALMKQLGDNAEKPVDGFTPAQRFFIGFGQVWCENVTEQRARELAVTDPHSPGRFRVEGTVQNNAEFRKAFNCKQGQPMAPANSCSVW